MDTCTDQRLLSIGGRAGRLPSGVASAAYIADRGHFTWPVASSSVATLTLSQWRWLITGVDWQRLTASAPTHWHA